MGFFVWCGDLCGSLRLTALSSNWNILPNLSFEAIVFVFLKTQKYSIILITLLVFHCTNDTFLSFLSDPLSSANVTQFWILSDVRYRYCLTPELTSEFFVCFFSSPKNIFLHLQTMYLNNTSLLKKNRKCVFQYNR